MATMLSRSRPAASLLKAYAIALPPAPTRLAQPFSQLSRSITRHASPLPKLALPCPRLSLKRLRSLSTAPSSSSSSTAASVSDASLTARLRTLFRTHGWSALTIYLLLSVADFSLTFLLICAVGADKVRDAEDWVLDALGWRRKSDGEPGKMRRAVEGWKGKATSASHTSTVAGDHAAIAKSVDPATAMGVVVGKEKERETSNSYSTLATTAVLAYAIHKVALLPVRIGITVAITPKVVRTLRAWGWNVGNAQVGVKAAGAAVTTKGATKDMGKL